jgi:hypothetical protein
MKSGERTRATECVAHDLQICQSILVLQDNDLQFVGCKRGQPISREFTLQNLSEVPLHFSMVPNHRTAQAIADKTLEFTVVDTEGEGHLGEADLKRGFVPELGRMRIRVSFRVPPARFEDISYEATFENTCDENNRCTVKMYASEGQEEGLEVTVISEGHYGSARESMDENGQMVRGREAVIDFGTCLTGIGHSRDIQIKNVSKSRLNVCLKADVENSVRFYLHTDLHDDTSEDDDDAKDDQVSPSAAGVDTAQGDAQVCT